MNENTLQEIFGPKGLNIFVIKKKKSFCQKYKNKRKLLTNIFGIFALYDCFWFLHNFYTRCENHFSFKSSLMFGL